MPLWMDHSARDSGVDSNVARYLSPTAQPQLVHVAGAYGDVYLNSMEFCEQAQARPLPGYGVAEGLGACAGLSLQKLVAVGFIEVSLPFGQSLYPSAWYYSLESLGGAGPTGGGFPPLTAVLKQEVVLPTFESLFSAGQSPSRRPFFLAGSSRQASASIRPPSDMPEGCI